MKPLPTPEGLFPHRWGHLVAREVALALGQQRDDLVQQKVETLFLARRDGHHVGEAVLRAPVRDQRQQVLLAHRVDLVQHQDHRAVQALDQRQREIVLRCAHRHAAGDLCGGLR